MRLQPWQVIALPFGLWAVVFFGLAVFKDAGHLAIWATPGFIVLAATYVLSPQINWWWFRRNPPPLSITATKLLETHFLYYKKLSPELKTRFRNRVALFILGNEFIRPVRADDSDAQSMRNNVPEDLKAAVAAIATQIFFGKNEVSVSKYEHFILNGKVFGFSYNFTKDPILENKFVILTKSFNFVMNLVGQLILKTQPTLI